MIHQDLLTEKEQKDLYLIHHMHHYEDRGEVVHELHHCNLFSQPNMKGEKYLIDHLYINNHLYHILSQQPTSILYDHANNQFSSQTKKIDGKTYFILV